ncbi:MAG: hypothetical protein V1869_02640 [Candidatus Omnitrophota bacterium]
MEKIFELDILMPEKTIFTGEVCSLVVPAALGYLGVLADHAPLIASLACGRITYRDNQGKETVINNNGKGFIEVVRNKATVLLF